MKPTYTKTHARKDLGLGGKMLQKGIQKVAILNWRHVTQNRDGWRRVTREVVILLGQWSHRRRRRMHWKCIKRDNFFNLE